MMHTPENSNKIHPQALVDPEWSHIDNDLIEVEKPDWFVPTSNPDLWKAPDCSDEEIQLAKSRLQKGVFTGYAKDSTVATEMPVLESGAASRYPLLKVDPKKLFNRLIRHKAYPEAYAYIALNRVDFEHQSLGRRYICQMLFDLRSQTDDHLTSDEVLIALSLFEKAGLLLNETVPNIKKYKGFFTAFDIAVDLAVHKGKPDILYFYLMDANARLLSAGLTQAQYNLRFITGNLSNELSVGKDLYSLREKNSNAAQEGERTKDQYLQDRAKYLDTLLIFLSVLQIKLEESDFDYLFNFGGGLFGEVKGAYSSLFFSLHISSGLYENMLEFSFINDFIKENDYQKLALILNSGFPFNYAYSFYNGFKLAQKENSINCVKEIIKKSKENESKITNDLSVNLVLIILSIPYGISYFFIFNLVKLFNSTKKSLSILTHSAVYTKSLLRPEVSDCSLQCAMSLSLLLAAISALLKTTLAIIEYPFDVVFRISFAVVYLSAIVVYGVLSAAYYLLSNLPLVVMALAYGLANIAAMLLTGCAQSPEVEVTYTEIEGNECALFMRDWDKAVKAGKVNTRQQRIAFVDGWEPSLVSHDLVDNNEITRGVCSEFDTIDKADLINSIARLNPPEWFTFSADTVANASIILNKEGLKDAQERLKRGVFVGLDAETQNYREFSILPEGASTRFILLKANKNKLLDRLVEHKAYNEFAVLLQSYKTDFELKHDFITKLIAADDIVHTISILSIIEQSGLEINKLALDFYHVSVTRRDQDGRNYQAREKRFNSNGTVLDQVIKDSLDNGKHELLAYFFADPKARILTIAPVMLRRTIEDLIFQDTPKTYDLLRMLLAAIGLNQSRKYVNRIFEKHQYVFLDPEEIRFMGCGREPHQISDEKGLMKILDFVLKNDHAKVLKLLFENGLSVADVVHANLGLFLAVKYDALECIKVMAQTGFPLSLAINENESCVFIRSCLVEFFSFMSEIFQSSLFPALMNNCGNYFSDCFYDIRRCMMLEETSSDNEVVSCMILSPFYALLSLPIRILMLLASPVLMVAGPPVYGPLGLVVFGLYACVGYKPQLSYMDNLKKELSEELGKFSDNESVRFINSFNHAKQSGRFNNEDDINTFVDGWGNGDLVQSSAPVRFFEMERGDINISNTGNSKVM